MSRTRTPSAPRRAARSAAAAVLALLLGFTGAHFPAAALAAPAGSADSATVSGAAPAPADSVAPALAAAPAFDALARLRAEFTPRNRAYSNTKTVLRFVEPLFGMLVAALVLFSGLAAGLRDIAHALGSRRYVRVLVFFALYAAIVGLVTLPLEWYDGWALEHQFGLSDQSLGAWFGDELKAGLATLAAFGIVPVLWLAYTAFAHSPRRWWLWLAAGTLPLVVAGTLLQPLVFDPLFNKFTPLRDEHLRGRIIALAERAGIPGRRVYEVDKSAQTKKYNAYVTGFGASQRIVLWDTTLKGMSEDEILFVVGHEMGHYRLGHIWKGILFTALLSFALFFIASRMCDAALARFGTRWGIRGMSDVASLPLLLLVLDLLAFGSQPLVNGWSRGIEHEADLYGLEITQNSDAAARAFVKLGSQNKSNPDPATAIKWMLYTHPPDAERVRLATSYRPWDEGKPMRFVR